MTGDTARTRPDRVSSKEVAQCAGVSQPTVSRVLSGRGPVLPATRERVLKAVAQLGYTPNLAGRMLQGARAIRLSVVASALGAAEVEVLDRLAAALEPAGILLKVIYAPEMELARTASDPGEADCDQIVVTL